MNEQITDEMRDIYALLITLTEMMQDICYWKDVKMDVDWLKQDLEEHVTYIIVFKHMIEYFKDKSFEDKSKFFDLFEYTILETAKAALYNKINLLLSNSTDPYLTELLNNIMEQTKDL